MLVIHEFVIPTPASRDRASKTVALPQGAQILGLINPNGAPLLVVRGDPQQPTQDKTFVAVRGDVPLTPTEETAAYVGSFAGYQLAAGREIYHLLVL